MGRGHGGKSLGGLVSLVVEGLRVREADLYSWNSVPAKHPSAGVGDVVPWLLP